MRAGKDGDGGGEEDEEQESRDREETGPSATMEDVKAARATHLSGMMMTSVTEDFHAVLDTRPVHEKDVARSAKLVRNKKPCNKRGSSQSQQTRFLALPPGHSECGTCLYHN